MAVLKRWVLACAMLVMAACATWTPRAVDPVAAHVAAGGERGACAMLFTGLDEAVRAANVRDGGAARIEGFPYLRTNRFLASFDAAHLDDAELSDWTERMRRLDQEARVTEAANLPDPARHALADTGDDLAARVGECGQLLLGHDLADHGVRALLAARVVVPPDYVALRRVLGLYPLTALFVRAGIGRWHRSVQAAYDRAPDDVPLAGRLTRYASARAGGELPATEVARVLERSARNPLGVPEPGADALARLFATHAPLWEVEVASPADRIGTPVWRDDGTIEIDTARPAVYQYVSYTRVGGRPLLQLNYTVWFPARPKTGPFDLVGGHLDGITWRVTLGADGRVLLYDSVHNCGCYHLFFPSPELELRPSARVFEEPALVPQDAPVLRPGEVVRLRIAHRTHYIEQVAGAVPDAEAIPLAAIEYDALQSLPRPEGGRRSLFRPDGIVPGTQRAERWLLWPMGIAEPGAMRQRGRHATAFVGRRHFDDPDLIEQVFVATGAFE
jgi:hypothetical protein